jgi:hypothetical protein
MNTVNSHPRHWTAAPIPGVAVGISAFKTALRNGYLNGRYGMHKQPTSNLSPLLFHLLPPIRSKAER